MNEENAYDAGYSLGRIIAYVVMALVVTSWIAIVIAVILTRRRNAKNPPPGGEG